jgi:hypothetical protein
MQRCGKRWIDPSSQASLVDSKVNTEQRSEERVVASNMAASYNRFRGSCFASRIFKGVTRVW